MSNGVEWLSGPDCECSGEVGALPPGQSPERGEYGSEQKHAYRVVLYCQPGRSEVFDEWMHDVGTAPPPPKPGQQIPAGWASIGLSYVVWSGMTTLSAVKKMARDFRPTANTPRPPPTFHRPGVSTWCPEMQVIAPATGNVMYRYKLWEKIGCIFMGPESERFSLSPVSVSSARQTVSSRSTSTSHLR